MQLANVTTPIRTNIVDIDTLLASEQSTERVFIAAQAALDESGFSEQCPHYLDALGTALSASPPYASQVYEDAYREASADRRWMAASLLTNSYREGEGATRLWSLAACADDPGIQALLKQHAVDESNHATFYLALLDLALPHSVDDEFREQLRQLSPGYTMAQSLFVVEGSPYGRAPTIDDFIQMNIAEIRTTLHHLMQRRALFACCDEQALPKVRKLLDRLLRDELRHVSYTAKLIEEMSAEAGIERLIDLFCRRFQDFNDITVDEFKQGVFD
ncbi:hypothetical protein [Massilia scottii]|uniref:hypothetical protein n=1 Tax=Massilia scottii TaxID=3057166 RepID=UPI002796DAAF|nr:hypothetical protein [Massilia sp. CCM 9029]MDQ1833863.1 hypothetical protein [Massilia sp. CCM 9029]